MKRIWFNHWFSAVYNIISMMRDGCREELYVIGTNKNDTAVYRSMCNEWYREPDNCSDDEYVDFCLHFCKQHNIDILVPRRGLSAIMHHAERFSAIGVRLFGDVSSKMIAILDDKIATYQFLTDRGFDCIPDMRIAHSLNEFSQVCDELSTKYKRICYKLSIDEGARSFRVIDNRIMQKRALLEKPGFKVDFSTAIAVLSQYDFSIPMLVMPYLDGPEISIDCMRTKNGDLIIPRIKTVGRYSVVHFDDGTMQLCSSLMDAIGVTMPINIQLRQHEDRMWLLEINPRMSGGLQLSCAAADINLPAIAINQLLGYDTPWKYPACSNRKVAHVEKAVCFN